MGENTTFVHPFVYLASIHRHTGPERCSSELRSQGAYFLEGHDKQAKLIQEVQKWRRCIRGGQARPLWVGDYFYLEIQKGCEREPCRYVFGGFWEKDTFVCKPTETSFSQTKQINKKPQTTSILFKTRNSKDEVWHRESRLMSLDFSATPRACCILSMLFSFLGRPPPCGSTMVPGRSIWTLSLLVVVMLEKRT